MHKIITCILLSFFSFFAFSQDVKVKKDQIFIDGVHLLNASTMNGAITFSNLQGSELFFLQHYVKTPTNPAYARIIFLQEKVVVNNHTLFLSRKSLVKLLLEHKVLQGSSLDKEAIDLFKLKFNEVIPISQQVNVNIRE